ncbi:MAG: hypothetical protein HY716_09475 [Planctomycetes bacterium]|nr:hypothetical protein [Planctomycetota bacterium]
MPYHNIGTSSFFKKIFTVFGLGCSIAGIVTIEFSGGRLKGLGRCVAGIVISVISGVKIFGLASLPWIERVLRRV